MTDDILSMFKGVDDVNPQRNSEYFRAGSYLCRIGAFKVKRNDDGLIRYIFELLVLAVLDPSEASKDPGGAHRVGHDVSWIMSKHNKPTMPNLKAALMVMTGVPQEEVTMEFCAALAGASQPLEGIFVEFSNKVITTKQGKPFTRITAKRVWTEDEVREAVCEDVLGRLGVELS